MDRIVIDKLVETARTLAEIQLEGVEDRIGFSNSDKMYGAFLAAAVYTDPTDEDSVRSLAALVCRYRRQSEQMVGVDMHSRFKALAQDRKVTADDRLRARNVVLAKPAVHPKFGARVVFQWNGFSYEKADAVKACGAKAFKESDGWKWAVFPDRAAEAAERLKHLGCQILGSWEVPEGLEVELPKGLPNLIRVERHDAKHLTIGWDFGNHQRWMQIARSLPNRKYRNDLKAWVIPLADLAIVENAFKQAGADVSQFAQFEPEAPTLSQISPDEPDYWLSANPETVAKMFEFQKDGLRWLTRPLRDIRSALNTRETKGMILADDMGLGKTIQTITAAGAICAAEEHILVVCPASLKLNWKREIEKWGFGPEIEDICVADGDYLEPARWMIVNYDILPRHYKRLIEIGYSVLVCDEAHYIKNRESNRAKLVIGSKSALLPKEPTLDDERKRARTVVDGLAAYATKRVFLLTGTPLTNRPKDLFNLLKAVKHPLGKNFKFFGQRFCDPQFNGFGTNYNGGSNLKELRERVDPIFLQRKKEDHLNLPLKIRTWLPVEVNLREYHRVMTEYERRREAGELSKVEHHLALITEARVCLATSKIDATIERVESAIEQGQKVLVFTLRTNVLQAIVNHFGEAAVYIDGTVGSQAKKSTGKSDRQIAEDRFMTDDSVRVIVGNLLAMGSGLNLTAGTHVIVNDLDWTPANHLQAEDRAYRIGQEKMVNVTYMLAAGTFDEELSVMLEEKFTDVKEFEDYDDGPLFEALIERLAAGPQNTGVKALRDAQKVRKTLGMGSAA